MTSLALLVRSYDQALTEGMNLMMAQPWASGPHSKKKETAKQEEARLNLMSRRLVQSAKFLRAAIARAQYE